jgi:hypothetical protein
MWLLLLLAYAFPRRESLSGATSIRLDARNDMQTDYRQASSGFNVRAEAIAEQMILWGVIATVIFLAVTMIRAA